MPQMAVLRDQVVSGVVTPQQGEAMIRELFPSVAAFPAVASLGRVVMTTPLLRIFAPLTWLMLAPFYFMKVLPLLGRRYTLTNRRLMIRRGIRPKPSAEVALADIEAVRVKEDSNSNFFRASTLEIVAQGKVALELPGVPEPQSFRHAILNACRAWVPGKTFDAEFIPASAMKK